MLFNSYEFIFIFLPTVFFTYHTLNYMRLTVAAKIFLVLSSLFFYSWWNYKYLPILLFSILINFSIGNILVKPSFIKYISKKAILIIGIAINLGLLGYFKYSNFFIENVGFILNAEITSLDLVLPLAISFFTFQQIAYLVDSYHKKTAEYSFLNYALFVSFFPQLIAGPIVHHKEMMPQFASKQGKLINYENVAAGIFIFSIGLFKKVVIADQFSVWATTGFDKTVILDFFEAWATSLSYTFQLYFDFSGYSDMAIGLGLLFNIKLPINFNSPYKAINIQDFWKRWHITLSNFLRDYVYIPLGGNRQSDFSTYNNIMITFLIGGLWHGAGWTFIFWGFLHGFALIIYRLWSKLGITMWQWLAWAITFNCVNIAWIFFRANEWSDATKILSGMLGISGFSLPGPFYEFTPILEISVLLGLCVVVISKNSIEMFQSRRLSTVAALYAGICAAYALLSMNKTTEFLYFNF